MHTLTITEEGENVVIAAYTPQGELTFQIMPRYDPSPSNATKKAAIVGYELLAYQPTAIDPAMARLLAEMYLAAARIMESLTAKRAQ